MKESITICLLSEDDRGEEIGLSWELLEQNLRLKSTFMYCDLNRIISVLEDRQRKECTTRLATCFLGSMEEVSSDRR